MHHELQGHRSWTDDSLSRRLGLGQIDCRAFLPHDFIESSGPCRWPCVAGSVTLTATLVFYSMFLADTHNRAALRLFSLAYVFFVPACWSWNSHVLTLAMLLIFVSRRWQGRSRDVDRESLFLIAAHGACRSCRRGADHLCRRSQWKANGLATGSVLDRRSSSWSCTRRHALRDLILKDSSFGLDGVQKENVFGSAARRRNVKIVAGQWATWKK